VTDLPSPFSPAELQKAVHTSLAAAYEAIPPGRTHALLFDGTAATGQGGAVRALYVQRLDDGWNIALEGDVSTHTGAAGSVVVAKSW